MQSPVESCLTPIENRFSILTGNLNPEDATVHNALLYVNVKCLIFFFDLKRELNHFLLSVYSEFVSFFVLSSR